MVLALALIALEMFVPSGGVIAILATAAVITSVVMVFVNEGPLLGFLYLAATAIVLPLAIASAIRWWPHTPMGRRILNLPPESEREAMMEQEEDPRMALIGRRGHALSDMLLSGAISIDGRSYDAVSETTAINRGDPIQVTDLEGNRIVVRPVDAESPSADRRRSSAGRPPVATSGRCDPRSVR